METEEKIRKTKKRWINGLTVLLFLMLAAILGYQQYKLMQKEEELCQITQEGEIFLDQSARLGLLPGMSTQEIQEKLNQVVEEGMMNVVITTEIKFEDGTAPGYIGIENSAANHYNYQVTLTMDETGEQLYQSGLIPPGYYVKEIQLEKALSKGEYPATATFKSYMEGEELPIGAAAVKVSVTVEN